MSVDRNADVATPEARIGTLEDACAAKGMRMTEQRRVIARVISSSHDHPDVEELHRRAAAVDSGISIATVYRTVRLFEEAGRMVRGGASVMADAVFDRPGERFDMYVETTRFLGLTMRLSATNVFPTPEMLAKARRRLGESPLPHVAALEAGDIHDLRHPDAIYDAIVMPTCAIPAPISPPTRACDELLGMP